MLFYTEDEARLISVDPLSSKLSIYVCSRDMSRGKLHNFFTMNQDQTCLIENSSEIENNIKSVYRRLRYEKPMQILRDSVVSLLEPFNISYKDFSVSVSRAAANRKPSDNMQINGPLLYIKEDSIDPTSIIELASLYQELPSKSRPLIFFEPSDDTLSLSAEIAKLNDKLALKPLGQTQNWGTTQESADSGDFSAFLKEFLSHSYTACEHTQLLSHEEFHRHSSEVLIQKLTSECLIIKSYDAMGDKFQALPIVKKLLSKLDYASEYMKNDSEMRYLLSLKAIVNLWAAYIDEGYSEGIDNSLAIADFLNNDFLKAHCFRLSHLVSGYSTLTGNMVAKAVKYFRETEDHEAYVYSQNNFLLNQLHTGKVDLDVFSELVEFAIKETPYLDRLSTIINNAGTAFLLNGNHKEAMQYYTRADDFSGQNIHHIGIDVNKCITRYMDGEKIQGEEIMQLHRRIVRANLPREYSYHQSYIHWTLAKLAGFETQNSKKVLQYLSQNKFMPYETVMKGNQTMVDFLASSQIYNKGKGRFTGIRGDFIHRTELFPIIHFQWM